MIPIPAIDIQDGKCVRLKMGDLDSAITYYENPIDAANFWLNEGTRKLHIVDLDGALAGQSSNLSVIASIRKTFLAPALSADSCIALLSTAVEPCGTHITICGETKALRL